MKPKIGVMGSSARYADESYSQSVAALADELGRAIAARDCVLVTGATTGIPDMVARAAHGAGALTIGISPAQDQREHVESYRLPIDCHDVIIYTGFGLKGRNVLNIRSSDIVIIFGGGIGTLNEFTIAYDEGKIIGVLSGTGRIADRLGEIIQVCEKPSRGMVLGSESPEELIDACVQEFRNRAET